MEPIPTVVAKSVKVIAEAPSSAKLKDSYRIYTPAQIEELSSFVIKLNMFAKQAGLSIGVVKTAQHYAKLCKCDEQK